LSRPQPALQWVVTERELLLCAVNISQLSTSRVQLSNSLLSAPDPSPQSSPAGSLQQAPATGRNGGPISTAMPLEGRTTKPPPDQTVHEIRAPEFTSTSWARFWLVLPPGCCESDVPLDHQ